MRYRSVQLARAVAALLIVVFHSTTMAWQLSAIEDGGPSWPQAGVDLFFAISGFIMVETTRKSWGQWRSVTPFLMRRLIRVVPMYWLFTVIKLIGLLRLPDFAEHGGLTAYHVVASFLFIPSRVPGETTIAPLLLVGWTLFFEMFFYALFAIALRLKARPVPLLCGVLTVLSGLGLLRTEAWPDATAIISPILMEFVFGMLIAVLLHRTRGMAPALSWFLLASALIAVVTSGDMIEPSQADLLSLPRVLAYGVPAAVALLAVIALELKLRFRSIPGLALLLLLGDASYAIYLSHGLVLLIPRVVWAHWPLRGSWSGPVLIVSSVILSSAVGVAIHVLIERPLGHWLHRVTLGPDLRPGLAGGRAET